MRCLPSTLCFTPVPSKDMVRICLEHGGIEGYRQDDKKDSTFQVSEYRPLLLPTSPRHPTATTATIVTAAEPRGVEVSVGEQELQPQGHGLGRPPGGHSLSVPTCGPHSSLCPIHGTPSLTFAHRTLSRSLSSSCCPIRPIPCVTQLLTFAEWLASDYGQMEVSRGYYRQHLAHWTAAGIARRWATDGLEPIYTSSVRAVWRFFGLLHSSSAPTTAARNTPNTAKFSW
jgi:hypothetical protein